MCNDASHPALEELRRLYAQLDTEMAGEQVECRRCGECCNFFDNDYVLFASALERALLELGAPGPLVLTDDGACPMLRGRLCSIHENRPLGCRTSFCHPGWASRQAGLYQRYRRKVADICTRHNLPWDYRPVFAR